MRHTFESVESSQKASTSGKKAIQDANDDDAEPVIDGSMTIGEALNGLTKSGSGSLSRQIKTPQQGGDGDDDEDEYIVRTDHLVKASK